MAVEKPKQRFANKIVIAPCSGVGQTVGTISRQAAYEIVDKLAPSETVLLCLPAYNIGVDEDVEMVKQNPMRIIAIEGCARLCMTNLLKRSGFKPSRTLVVSQIAREMKLAVQKSKNRAKLGEEEEKVLLKVIQEAIDTVRGLRPKCNDEAI